MKAHISGDAKSDLTHSLVTTSANEHDLNQLENLLHSEEPFVSADVGYQSAEKRKPFADRKVDWCPSQVRALKQHPRLNKVLIRTEHLKASIRTKVEHPFRIIKCQFGFVKASYKGLVKNDNHRAMLLALANIVRCGPDVTL